MNPTLEIFSQGEEIVTGQTVDTNAAWLSQQAFQLGFTVTRHTAVGDKLEDMALLLMDIAPRADCCICTGGLGPTSDDLTAEAIAMAFHRPLQFDEIAFAQIQRFFANRNKPMPESNRKQALLPEGADRIDNAWGTAPAFSLQQDRCWFVFLPGVPSEMRAMFLATIRPTMNHRFSLNPGKLITLRTIGIGESDLQERIKSVAIADAVQLGFRADSDEVQVKLLFPAGYAKIAITALISEICEKLGHYIFSVDEQLQVTGGLVSVIDRLMTEGLHTLSAIETASQGLLAAKCLNLPWLLEMRYEQSLKKLGEKLAVEINFDDLMTTAKALATATRKNSEADLVLVQLYAGNKNQFYDKNQAISLFNVLLHDGHFKEATHTVAGPAERKQNQAALMTLDLLRRHLQPSLIVPGSTDK